MKRNLLMVLGAAALSFSSSSNAEFIFQLSSSNACETISGHWSGKGRATNWLLGECVYHGSGDVSTLDNTGHFTVSVNADKNSGNPICPEHVSQTLKAVCSNGVVSIHTDFGSLKGTFSETSGSASGTLSVTPGMEADVSIKFTRAG